MSDYYDRIKENNAARKQRWANFFDYFRRTGGVLADIIRQVLPPPKEAGVEGSAQDGYQIIGAVDLSLTHRTAVTGPANLLTPTTEFKTAGDWATDRADSARIELVNNTGSTQTIREVMLKGKLILRNSGTFVHDKFKNDADIERNGEKEIIYQSNEIVSNAHTSNIAKYLWDFTKEYKHYYGVQMTGTCYWLHPGVWATLKVGGAGQSENIDSVVKVESVSTSKRPGSLGTTNIMLAEVQENWKYDSTYKARTKANALPWRNQQGSSVYTVSASTDTAIAHTYCTGAADEVEIQSLIDMANEQGGGIVHLGPGTFVTAAAIAMKSNVTLEGEGDRTIIEKNGNFEAITATGGSGTELTGIVIRSLKVTRNSADTNAQELIKFTYVDYSLIQDCLIEDSYDTGIFCNVCDNCTVTKVRVIDFRAVGIYFDNNINLTISGVTIDNASNTIAAIQYGIRATGTSPNFTLSDSTIRNMTSTSAGPQGVQLAVTDSLISNLTVKDLTTSDGSGTSFGINMTNIAHRCRLVNCNVDNVDNSGTAANAHGIYFQGDNGGISNGTVQECSGTGLLVAGTADATMITGIRCTSNGTNFTDGGTNTSAIVETS